MQKDGADIERVNPARTIRQWRFIVATVSDSFLTNSVQMILLGTHSTSGYLDNCWKQPPK